MKKIYDKTAVKLLAVILLSISAFLFVGSFLAQIFLESENFYKESAGQLRKEHYELMCSRYSVVALSQADTDFGMEDLKDTRFSYGVIKKSSLTGVDLNDDSNYVVKNFTEKITEDDVNTFFYEVGPDTEVELSDTIFGPCYMYSPSSYVQQSFSIDGYYYDYNEEQFYFQAGKTLYPVEKDYYELVGDGTLEPIDGNEFYFWDSSITIPVKDVTVGTTLEIKNVGTISDYQVEYVSKGQIYISKEDKSEYTPYYVVSFVKEGTASPGRGGFFNAVSSWEEMDMFDQTDALITYGMRYRYVPVVVIVVSFLVGILCFAFLMAAAGHHKGREGVVRAGLDKIPWDLYGAAVCLAELFLAFLAVDGVWLGWEHMITSVLGFVMVGEAAVLLGISYCMSLSVNIKCGKFFQHTLIYKILHFLFRQSKRLKSAIREAAKSIPLYSTVWLVLGVLAFFEFFGILITGASMGVLLMLWLFEKILLFILAGFAMVQLEKIKQGAEQIRSGKLDYRISTGKMYGGMEKFAEDINGIGSGLNEAVAEKMKSERFKTELITNVSHDIKTPLTSIINYVDLLEKEDVKEENIQEYIAVLSRQSARLKKLIEDLIEASKASTGSLKVDMQPCDAGVMLVQTIGEFEERLKKENIELVITKPEETVMVTADSRHLWRVFDNLMTNICKYAQSGTRAYVTLEQSENQVSIIFRNISKEPLNISSDELMERFVRGDSSRNTSGSGLGLSIAKSLMELMQGHLELVLDGDLFKVVLTFKN